MNQAQNQICFPVERDPKFPITVDIDTASYPPHLEAKLRKLTPYI